ncbi:MAG: helix-turn-helix domain-containing protein [Crocinitomicaceae bacterium]|nr:helix-turn-helix domain-containing protein [Crocinitomicaceae bacterium]
MESSINVSHAKKLRFLRKQSDKKQSEIAHYLGLSQQAYSKLENGETGFSDETIEKISHFFGISPAEFERVQESVYVGNNSYNYASSIHNVDERFLTSYETLLEQNRKLYEDLIREKDERIKLLEALLLKADGGKG